MWRNLLQGVLGEFVESAEARKPARGYDPWWHWFSIEKRAGMRFYELKARRQAARAVAGMGGAPARTVGVCPICGRSGEHREGTMQFRHGASYCLVQNG